MHLLKKLSSEPTSGNLHLETYIASHSQLLFWSLITIGTVLEVIGDGLFKADKMVLGFISYGAGAAFWAWSLKYHSLSIAIVIFAVLNILLAVAVGHWFFDESLNLKQWVGLGFGLVCIALLAT